jgi:isopenicillin N synthase-like dioxygenase
MAKSKVKSDPKFDLLQYPIVDLSGYLTDQKTASTECQTVAYLLKKFGFICVKDPRVNNKHNDEFLDMMEKYYEQSDEIKAKDIRKEVFYQVGLTPARIELARNRCELIANLDRTEKPLTICPPGTFLLANFSKRLFNINLFIIYNRSR